MKKRLRPDDPLQGTRNDGARTSGRFDAAQTVQRGKQARTSTHRFFGAAFGIIAVLMSIWTLASPLMSIPDEPAHAIRAAAVVRGELIGPASNAFKGAPAVLVPAYINYTGSMACFAFKPKASAACQKDFVGDPDEMVLSTTSASINSPVYYAIVGLPTLMLSGDTALYGMRIVNALITALFFATLLALLWRQPSAKWSIIAVIVALTPMALFLGGSINPNAAEMAAAGTLFVALVLAFRGPSSRRELATYAGISIASAAILTSGRSVTLLWLLLITVAALAFATKDSWRALIRQRSTWVAIAGIATVAGVALVWFRTPQPIPAVPADAADSTSSPSLIVQVMLERTFDFWTGMIGQFGWLDQPSPAITYQVWNAGILIVLIGGMFLGRGRARAVTVFFVGVLVVVPVVIQTVLFPDAGWVWQGRYMLAVLLCALVAAGFALDESSPGPFTPRTTRAVRVALVLMAAVQFYTFLIVLRRYVIGQGPWLVMLREPLWQPPLGWIALSAMLVLTLVIATWGLLRISHSMDDPIERMRLRRG